MNDFEDLFSGLLGATLADTFGGGRRFTITLMDGRVLPEIGGIYEPRYVQVEIGEGGSEYLAPFPRLQLRRDQLKAAGLTDPQSALSGAHVMIDGEGFTLDTIRDDGWTYVDAKVIGAQPEPVYDPAPQKRPSFLR